MMCWYCREVVVSGFPCTVLKYRIFHAQCYTDYIKSLSDKGEELRKAFDTPKP